MLIDRRSLLASCAASAASIPLAGLAAGMQGATQAPAKPWGRTKNTRFAANLEMWWTHLPFLDRIRAAADFGFPAIEFWPYEGKDIDAIAALVKEKKLAVAQFSAWGFTPGMNDPKNQDAVAAKIEEACAVAHRLDAKQMCVVGGNDQPGMTQQEMHLHIVEALRRVAPIAEREDVTLLLEPMNIRVDHKGHCLYGSEKAVAICRAVGSTHVKILWDLYHMQISEGDLCRRLREGFDQLGYVQVADNPGRNEPGTGEVRWSRVYRELKDLGYRGFVGLECSPSDDEENAAKRAWSEDEW